MAWDRKGDKSLSKSTKSLSDEYVRYEATWKYTFFRENVDILI